MSGNNEQLKKLHEALLDILDEIDRICRKNDIMYFLDSGTALGAIRHGGFIPWDDDADVGMLREDYERFLVAAKEELSPRFFLQNQYTQPEYLQFNSKIRLNHTFFPEIRNEGTSLHQGIFVDIFPFDYISDNQMQAKADVDKSRKLLKLFAIRHRHPKSEALPRKIIRSVAKVVPESIILRQCINHFHKYDSNPTNTVVSYSYKMNSYKYLWFSKEEMYPSVDIVFEGHTYEIMNNWNQYLTTMYGDYMKLPPEDKRVWHFEGEIRFEHGE